jgi:hypothetical protein
VEVKNKYLINKNHQLGSDSIAFDIDSKLQKVEYLNFSIKNKFNKIKEIDTFLNLLSDIRINNDFKTFSNYVNNRKKKFFTKKHLN